MTRTNNLSNTQFGYQIVFFIHIHGYIWLAEGCHWHLLPRQIFTTSFALAKDANGNLQPTIYVYEQWLGERCLWHLFPRQTCCRHLLTGGMFLLLQRN